MAVISDSTFDPLRRYVRVRLQQGVPIVDADVNEREDIHAFELRAFLKWFVGDGVPEGNNGFRVVGTGLADDFIVSTGLDGAAGPVEPLSRIGRCLVQGLDVIIDADTKFTEQLLHPDRPDAATLAARWQVPVIERMKSDADGTVLVYLDVWDRLVTSADDDKLLHQAIGVESCARMKREWVVRVAADETLPDPPDGHAHTPLAVIGRRAGDAVVRPGDVVDRRVKRLLVPPATLVEDVLGIEATDYRTGVGRPLVSLRDALNALLHGDLPSTPDTPIDRSPSSDVIGRGFVVDATGGLVATWNSDRNGPDQVFAARLDLTGIEAGFAPTVPVTTGAADHISPHLTSLPGGDLLVGYQSGLALKGDIAMKRGTDLAAVAGATEIVVANTNQVSESAPFLLHVGNRVVIFFHRADTAGAKWQFRLWNPVDETFDAAAQALSTKVTTNREFHAAIGLDATVWAAFRAGDDIQALQFNPANGAVANEVNINAGSTGESPFVLCAGNGDVWVFLRNPNGIWAQRFRNGAWEAVAQIVGAAATPALDRQPCAVEDASGGIWLLWTTGPTSEGQIAMMRRHPDRDVWDVAGKRIVVSAADDDSAPHALVAPDGALWLFWSTDREGSVDVFYKRLIISV